MRRLHGKLPQQPQTHNHKRFADFRTAAAHSLKPHAAHGAENRFFRRERIIFDLRQFMAGHFLIAAMFAVIAQTAVTGFQISYIAAHLQNRCHGAVTQHHWVFDLGAVGGIIEQRKFSSLRYKRADGFQQNLIRSQLFTHFAGQKLRFAFADKINRIGGDHNILLLNFERMLAILQWQSHRLPQQGGSVGSADHFQ